MTTKEPAFTSTGTKSPWSKEGNGLSKCTPFSSLTNLRNRPSGKREKYSCQHYYAYSYIRFSILMKTKPSRIKLNDFFIVDAHFLNKQAKPQQQNEAQTLCK